MPIKLSQSQLKEVLSYDPEKGEFYWLNPKSHRVKTGDRAGYKAGNGYILIGVKGTRLYAHRLAWLYMTGEWPEQLLDHIDENPVNNKFSNLRLADKSQNGLNRGMTKRNTSGHKGVTFNKRKQKWTSVPMVKGVRHFLGYFERVEDAAEAYVSFARNTHKEFLHEGMR